MSSDRTPRNYVQFIIWSLLILVTVLAVLLGGGVFYHARYIEPRQHYEAIKEDIRALALRRPAELTPRQWESAVAWTGNLHGNSLLIYQTDLPTLRAFHRKLEEKLKGHVDLQTIHWVWDEYGKVCPGGKITSAFEK